MDSEDRERALSNKDKLFRLLKLKRVITNEEARAVAGSRAMGRAHELKKELGDDVIQIRKVHGAVWEIRYQQKALARSAETPVALPDQDWGPLSRLPEERGAYTR